LALGDRIAVIDKGRLQQIGPPEEIYQHPANAFVKEFFDLQEIHTLAERFRRSDRTTESLKSDNSPAPAAKHNLHS
jgi:ABC-type sugar transport system ATPase subunit